MSAPGSPKKKSPTTKGNDSNSQTTHEDREDISESDPVVPSTSSGLGTPIAIRKRLLGSGRERSVTPQRANEDENLPESPSQTRSGRVFKSNDRDSPGRQSGRGRSETPAGGVHLGGSANDTGVLKNITDWLHRHQKVKLCGFCVVLLVCLLGGLNLFASGSGQIAVNIIYKKPNVWQQKRHQLDLVFRQLQKESFPSQFNHTFDQIYSLVDFSLRKKEPSQPSAIAVMIPMGMNKYSFPHCFIKKLANVVNRVFEPDRNIPTYEMNLQSFSADRSITSIHDDLKTYFDGGGRSVLVIDVDKIMNETHLLVFHAFCDNSHAYQKRSIFFFLLPVPEEIYNKYEWDPRNRNRISYDVLDEAWRSALTDDKRPAFIARVAGSAILLQKGDTC